MVIMVPYIWVDGEVGLLMYGTHFFFIVRMTATLNLLFCSHPRFSTFFFFLVFFDLYDKTLDGSITDDDNLKFFFFKISIFSMMEYFFFSSQHLAVTYGNFVFLSLKMNIFCAKSVVQYKKRTLLKKNSTGVMP